MALETKVCHLLSDLGYSTGSSVDLQRVFSDLYKKGLIEGSDYSALLQKIRKYPSQDNKLEVG